LRRRATRARFHAAIRRSSLRTRPGKFGKLVKHYCRTCKAACKLGILGLITVWAIVFHLGSWSNFLPFAAQRPGSLPLGPALGVGVMAAFYSFGGWWEVSKIAGEVRDPGRTLQRAMILGVLLVTTVYVLVSTVFLYLVPLDKVASDETFVAQVGAILFGPTGGVIFAAIVVICVLGGLAGFVMSAPRVYYAMAKDGLFFRNVAKLHPKYKTPAVSLMVQMVWTCVLCISGSYGQLLDYIIFAVLVFYILTIAGLFVLRAKRPNVPRPYRAIGYPVLPAIYILMAVFIDIVLLRYKPQYTWPGLFIVLLGIPVYFLWSKRSRNEQVEA
jgi:APA family basic amino acid/polyamine antiporter